LRKWKKKIEEVREVCRKTKREGEDKKKGACIEEEKRVLTRNEDDERDIFSGIFSFGNFKKKKTRARREETRTEKRRQRVCVTQTERQTDHPEFFL
jgi:hypothetical protein